MAELKRYSLVKPTVQTRFHIDFDWWRQNDRDWRVYLHSYLCPQHQEAFSNLRGEEQVDWVDPETAEVHPVDGIQQVLINHCAQAAGFLDTNMTLVDGVFRLLLSNGNTPMTPLELADTLGRSPQVILQTLSGGRVYKGLRPCPGC